MIARLRDSLKLVIVVAFSALAEKNPHRQLSVRAPFVLSMTRLVLLALTAVWCAVALTTGLGGWPIAVLGIGLAFALPVVSVLEKSGSGKVLELAGKILERFGVGDVGAAPRAVRPDRFQDDERGEG